MLAPQQPGDTPDGRAVAVTLRAAAPAAPPPGTVHHLGAIHPPGNSGGGTRGGMPEDKAHALALRREAAPLRSCFPRSDFAAATLARRASVRSAG
jgi:hypothetical protein